MLFTGIRFEKTVYSHFPKLWVDSQSADKQESTLILTLGKKYIQEFPQMSNYSLNLVW